MSDVEVLDEVVVTQETHVDDSPIDTEAQEKYSAWKANSPALYDYLNTTNNVWPSFTVQFFPDKDTAKQRRTTYRLLTSTCTSSQLPQHLQIGTVTMKSTFEEADLSKYDAELQEFSTTDPITGKLTTIQQILHQGEINRARIMPQNPDLISTITSTGGVYVFDKTKHASHESEARAEVECRGHSEEGFALAWNNNHEGTLVTGAMDGMIKLWDITRFKKGERLESSRAFVNVEGVNDVDWCPFHDSMFVSGSEDDLVKVWDTREKNSGATKTSGEGHTSGVNAVSWSKGHKYALCSGDGAGQVKVWDMRNFQTPVSSIQAHKGGISAVEFNPSLHNMVASAGAEDNAVKLWDLAKDDPLVFHHAGHLLGVNDIAWNPHDPLMVASVSNDNTIHLWKPSGEAMRS